MHDNLQIQSVRPERNAVNPLVPYHFLQEEEPDSDGRLQKVNTLFLTGKECVFKCLMCDLWKNTLHTATPQGAIVEQIDYALSRLPAAEVIKLYNSSNFFDTKAIPVSDYAAIIERVQIYQRVIVENHPKLCNNVCVEFAGRLPGKLEIAMGLETIHPNIFPRLNKQMTPEDFRRTTAFLRNNDIDVRAFVLLNPPYLTGEKENIEWAVKTVEFAFDSGAQRCAVIPTRGGNGIMELLAAQGNYISPSVKMLETVFEICLQSGKGQVFVDTWDIGFMSRCSMCFQKRVQRLQEMNMCQKIFPPVNCSC